MPTFQGRAQGGIKGFIPFPQTDMHRTSMGRFSYCDIMGYDRLKLYLKLYTPKNPGYATVTVFLFPYSSPTEKGRPLPHTHPPHVHLHVLRLATPLFKGTKTAVRSSFGMIICEKQHQVVIPCRSLIGKNKTNQVT